MTIHMLIDHIDQKQYFVCIDMASRKKYSSIRVPTSQLSELYELMKKHGYGHIMEDNVEQGRP